MNARTTPSSKMAGIDARFAVVDGMLMAEQQLMRAAMDAIADKDEGKVSDALMVAIDEASRVLTEGASRLEELAGTEIQRQLADQVGEQTSGFLERVQRQLVRIREASCTRIAEKDHALDRQGGAVDEHLERAPHARAGGDAGIREAVLAVSDMHTARSLLMLAAMDAIVDEDAGDIDDEHLATIRDAMARLNAELRTVEAAARATDERSLVGLVQDGLSSLESGIAVEDGLKKIGAPVPDGQAEADDARASSVESGSLASIVAFLATQGILIPTCLILIRSIVGPLNRVITGLGAGAEQVSTDGASERDSSPEEVSAMAEQNTGAGNPVETLSGRSQVDAVECDAAAQRLSDAVVKIRVSADEAARNTADLIAGAVQNAELGVEIGEQIAESLAKITTLSGQVSRIAAEVSAAGIEQVDTAVTRMEQVTQSSAANAEESASASEDLSGPATPARRAPVTRPVKPLPIPGDPTPGRSGLLEALAAAMGSSSFAPDEDELWSF